VVEVVLGSQSVHVVLDFLGSQSLHALVVAGSAVHEVVVVGSAVQVHEVVVVGSAVHEVVVVGSQSDHVEESATTPPAAPRATAAEVENFIEERMYRKTLKEGQPLKSARRKE
jgi:hypothetical protein